MCMISLYKVIGVIRVMALRLGVLNGSCDMVNSAYDCVCGVLANVSCSDRLGGDICASQCIYAFRHVQIASYDVGGCNIDVIIDPGEVD